MEQWLLVAFQHCHQPHEDCGQQKSMVLGPLQQLGIQWDPSVAIPANRGSIKGQDALGNMHPLQQETGRHLPCFGVTTVERLRGNPAVMEFVNNNSNMEEHAQGFNSYHTMENMETEEGNIEDASVEG